MTGLRVNEIIFKIIIVSSPCMLLESSIACGLRRGNILHFLQLSSSVMLLLPGGSHKMAGRLRNKWREEEGTNKMAGSPDVAAAAGRRQRA
jgi:hypothetical protein